MTRGGKRPGAGRPKSFIERAKKNFKIRVDLIDWLVDHKPQHMHIEKALDEYIKIFKAEK